MGTQNDRGQAIVELVLCTLVIMALFYMISELGHLAIREQRKTRFVSIGRKQ